MVKGGRASFLRPLPPLTSIADHAGAGGPLAQRAGYSQEGSVPFQEDKYKMYPRLFQEKKALYKPSAILISHIEQNVQNINIDYSQYNNKNFVDP